MPEFPQSTIAQIATVNFLYYTDKLDDLAEISLYPSDAPNTPIKLPGLWAGEDVTDSWRADAIQILGADGVLLQERGRAPLRIRLRRLLLSDRTIENLTSGALVEGGLALAEAMGLEVGNRTCYDELRDIVDIFRRFDSISGARAIWRIDSELANIYGLDKIVFVSHNMRNPPGAEWMEVSLDFEEYTEFNIDFSSP